MESVGNLFSRLRRDGIRGLKQLDPRLPLWIPSFLVSLLSLMWVGAATSIRASTHSWFETLLTIENAPTSDPEVFHIFQEKFRAHNRWQDFLGNSHNLSAGIYER